MKHTILLTAALLFNFVASAQLYVNGKEIPNDTKYINIKSKFQSTIKADFGQKDYNSKSLLTNKEGKPITAITWVGVFNYMDKNGWKPIIKGKTLNAFMYGVQSTLLFVKKE